MTVVSGPILIPPTRLCCPGCDAVVPRSGGSPGFPSVFHPDWRVEHRDHLCWTGNQKASVSWRLGDRSALQDFQVNAWTQWTVSDHVITLERRWGDTILLMLTRPEVESLPLSHLCLSSITLCFAGRLTRFKGVRCCESIYIWKQLFPVSLGLLEHQTTKCGLMLRACLTTKAPFLSGRVETCLWRTWTRMAWTFWRWVFRLK